MEDVQTFEPYKPFEAHRISLLTGIELAPCAKCEQLPKLMVALRTSWASGAIYGRALANCRCGELSTQEERFEPKMSQALRRDDDKARFVVGLFRAISCLWNKKQLPETTPGMQVY